MEKPECPEEVAAGGGKVHWKAKREVGARLAGTAGVVDPV